MALLDTFKQKVLDLGRSEARAKARPLLVGDEAFDRSAAGLDRRDHESFVLFWLLSDRALFLVAGGRPEDLAFRIPYEAVGEIALDFDENEEFLPWYVRIALHGEGPGAMTTLDDDETTAGNPLAPPRARSVDQDERGRLARGELVPLAGFAALPKKFRSALRRRIELSGGTLHITGEEAADRKWARARKRSRKSG
jgi:hypothetical protein